MTTEKAAAWSIVITLAAALGTALLLVVVAAAHLAQATVAMFL